MKNTKPDDQKPTITLAPFGREWLEATESGDYDKLTALACRRRNERLVKTRYAALFECQRVLIEALAISEMLLCARNKIRGLREAETESRFYRLRVAHD